MSKEACRSGQQCPKGHVMDPNWNACPYCEAEERSGQKTSRPEVIVSNGERRTTVGDVPKFSEERKTRAMPSGAPPEPGGRAGLTDTRKIVGVLVTYTWVPGGQLFPVREGKNYIGRGEVSGEPAHQVYEIQVPQDEKMSGEHALILCRAGNYEIIDQMSSNGTILDGAMIKSNQSVELKNYAEIRTGTTIWSFVKFHQPKGSQEEPVHHQRERIIEERIIEERIIEKPVPEDDDRETKVK
jgi:hypothetical protein